MRTQHAYLLLLLSKQLTLGEGHWIFVSDPRAGIVYFVRGCSVKPEKLPQFYVMLMLGEKNGTEINDTVLLKF